MGIRFADFTSFFLNIPWKWNNLVSLRSNYFIFIGYLKMGGGGGGGGLEGGPLWIHHWTMALKIANILQSLNHSECNIVTYSLIWTVVKVSAKFASNSPETSNLVSNEWIKVLKSKVRSKLCMISWLIHSYLSRIIRAFIICLYTLS